MIGSPRCGTTCISRCLRHAPGIPGFDEGHFLSNLLDFAVLRHSISTRIAENKHESADAVGASHFHKYISEVKFYNIFKQGYMQALNCHIDQIFDDKATDSKKRKKLPLTDKYFVDKSPGPKGILITKYLVKMWPEAKFIFLKRRSIENIHSRMKKFENNTYTEESFTKHCKQWVNDLNYFRQDAEPFLKPEQYIQIDHYDIMTKPELLIDTLCNFIDDLEQYRWLMINFLKNKFPESTNDSKPPPIYSIDSIPWENKYKEIHNKICLEKLEEEGYTLDDSYRKV